MILLLLIYTYSTIYQHSASLRSRLTTMTLNSLQMVSEPEVTAHASARNDVNNLDPSDTGHFRNILLTAAAAAMTDANMPDAEATPASVGSMSLEAHITAVTTRQSASFIGCDISN